MSEFFASITAAIESTGLSEQFATFDAPGLFTNPWFIVPFIGMIIYFLIKKQPKNIILVGLGVAVFLFMGTHFAEGLINRQGFIQLNKVLPILGMGIVVVGVVVYLAFVRSD
jgi:hypothetical protein